MALNQDYVTTIGLLPLPGTLKSDWSLPLSLLLGGKSQQYLEKFLVANMLPKTAVVVPLYIYPLTADTWGPLYAA
jgi:hypothetical protein